MDSFNLFGDNLNCDSDSDSSSEPCVSWIFGYGSLIWNPGFVYSECLTGYVRGFSRKFYQGNKTHRGTPENPGIVVTLVEEEEENEITWGVAYKLTGDQALAYLEHRECKLGGYEVRYTKFYPQKASEFSNLSGEAFPVLCYIATSNNNLWIGEDSLEKIASQICKASGPSGHNIEYLLRLSSFMREIEAEDKHLFELEKLVRKEITRQNICMYSVMGEQPSAIQRDPHESHQRQITFEHTSRIPEKKLRCLNI